MNHYYAADWGNIALGFGGIYAFQHWEKAGIWLIFFVISWFGLLLYERSLFVARVNEFLCPRCEKPFIHIDSRQHPPFDKLNKNGRRNTWCQNCDLPLWASNADDTDWHNLADHQVKTASS